jgi:uncharacterized protein
MFRIVSAVVLAGLLAPRLMAAPPEVSAPATTYPGAELFQNAWKYDQGLGTPINIPEAMRLYRDAAAAGHPLANARLAYIYYSGNGLTPDKAQAERLARGTFPGVSKAAETNDPVAELIASLMYFDGLGVARDGEEALRWLRKAADQKLPLAQADLGVAYENGIGVPRDIAEAVRWFRAAADQNSAMAQAYLGDFYHRGEGVPRDDCEAARLYALSAAQNFAHGQTNLGYMYEHGCGVPQNVAEAVRLYRLAAHQGFDVGEANLGAMYETGCGVPQDLNKAVMWYRRAAAQGNAQAIQALRCLGYDE